MDAEATQQSCRRKVLDLLDYRRTNPRHGRRRSRRSTKRSATDSARTASTKDSKPALGSLEHVELAAANKLITELETELAIEQRVVGLLKEETTRKAVGGGRIHAGLIVGPVSGADTTRLSS